MAFAAALNLIVALALAIALAAHIRRHTRTRPPAAPAPMAPVRRYLRISKHVVLECRIYLDNPALAQSWLLRARDPVLPRVMASVRPLVLPKLREERERERSRRKGSKKKRVKDVVVQGRRRRCWAGAGAG